MNWLKIWWPAIVWAIVISLFSTHAFTAENTSRFIVPMLHWLFPHASPHRILRMHYLIRKVGHFTEYFILSLLILRGIRAGRHETHVTWAVMAVLLVAGYAALDEFHQRFVPGRTPAVRDVMIDTAGGLAAQLIAGFVFLWIGARPSRKSPNGES